MRVGDKVVLKAPILRSIYKPHIAEYCSSIRPAHPVVAPGITWSFFLSSSVMAAYALA